MECNQKDTYKFSKTQCFFNR